MKTLSSLTDTQIRKYYENEPRFGGCFANDTLHNPDPKKIYVINLENQDEGGSHWVLLGLNNYYADSYGAVPTAAVSRYVKKYNEKQFQGLNDTDCGFFAMFIGDNMLRGNTPTMGLKPGQYAFNYTVLQKYFADK